MIEPGDIKGQLGSVPDRAERTASARVWASGDMGVPESLLPDVSEAARQALYRIASQCQSLGPRIVSTKVSGVVGSVTWGGDSTAMDEALRDADLEALADDVLESGLSSGILAGIVRRDPATDAVRIEPMLGHVEPIYAPESPTLVAGILHAWTDHVNGRPVWTVRIYDFTERTMREWRRLGHPSDLVKREAPDDIVEPDAQYPNGAPMPRFQVIGRDAERMPKGEMAKLLPLLYADWSSQVRGSRIEEATAIPQMVVKGDLERGDDQRSPTHVIRVLGDGDAHYLVPGDLSSLHTQHDRVLERVREDGSLPGAFGGGQTPSGEAMREQNAKFISWNKRMAARVSRLLTDLVRDLADALGIPDAPLISVEINREFTKAQDVEDTTALYEAGLVEHGAAVRHLTPFIPSWEDADVEAFIERESRPLNAQAFLPSTPGPDGE